MVWSAPLKSTRANETAKVAMVTSHAARWRLRFRPAMRGPSANQVAKASIEMKP